jgi:predicted nucleic acid-binding protein
MVLVDTSVWIEHLRVGEPALAELLTEASVLIHPFITGELACGNLKNRTRVLADLNTLPASKSASHNEVFRLIENRRLWGKGIGWVDGHLLASALVTECQFWTLDKRLRQVARDAGVASPKNV